MSELILHHYDVSPFSEKIRKIFAAKNLSWRAVEQPIVAPKPKLTPLTGGYRRIPVLQIGADVYCDTAIIAREIERRHPDPACLPSGLRGAAEIVAQWADHWLFQAAVPPAIVVALPALPKEFIEDRRALSPGFSLEALTAAVPDAKSRLTGAFAWIADQVAHQPFVLGDAFTVADAACFHIVWFLRNDPSTFAAVMASDPLRAWFERIEGMGQGRRSDLDADEALEIARVSEPSTETRSDGSDPNGVEPGQTIRVQADDYGSDPVEGEAVVVTIEEIAIRREDPEVGRVVVHFPRTGFRVTR